MSSPPGEPRRGRPGAARAAAADDDAALYYRWAAIGFHSASSFGRFPEPPLRAPAPSEPGQAAAPPEAPAAPRLGGSLHEALAGRVSRRAFGEEPLDAERVGALLWAAHGQISAPGEPERRTVPSGGALFPLRLVVLARAVEGLTEGAYRYAPATGALEALPEVHSPGVLGAWFRTQHIDYGRAAAVVFFVGLLDRTCARYGERGYRYLLLEAGHAAQNLCLAATALDVPHVPVGGFDDDRVNAGLQLPRHREATVYSVVLGRPL
ncbi:MULTISPECIES: SagB/ThcOx family dehydrogenase [Sorangium]|uniref:SagB/ThcOx family dehydrogenase n=1 Tax=Sorangium TaxID=39643 RepID=UPI003D9C5ADB